MRNEIIFLIQEMNINENTKITYDLSVKLRKIRESCNNEEDLKKWYNLRNGRDTIKTMLEFIK